MFVSKAGAVMTHPSRNFYVLSLFCVFMFVRLRVQGFESSVNKEFQKKKLVNSKTIIYGPLEVFSSARTNLFQEPPRVEELKGMLLALPTNIRLGWNVLQGTNACVFSQCLSYNEKGSLNMLQDPKL